VFPKTKRRKILIVCRCLILLGSTSSRHLFEEWPSPHWLVPYTFWCRAFQVYFHVHLLYYNPIRALPSICSMGACSQVSLTHQFFKLWFKPVLGGYSENPDTSSDIKNWHPVNIIEVIFRLIPRVLDIIHHAIRQLNIWKLCRISEMLISSFDIRSKARYQG
jgi:hypothetical protein